jgi:hypothetical protein
MSDINMLYLMRKFPNLERLSIIVRFSKPRIGSIVPSQMVTEEVIIRFFEFVSQVPKLGDGGVFFYNDITKSYRFFLAPLLKRNDMELKIEYYTPRGQATSETTVIIRNKKNVL